MKNIRLFTIISFCAAFASAGAQINFENSSGEVITVKPAASTGLSAVYVLPSTDGVKVSYRDAGMSASSHRWQRFDSRGGGYAEPVAATIEGDRSEVSLTGGDSGYIVTPSDGAAQQCFWVVDYSRHECVLDALTVPIEQDCGQQRLVLDGSAPRIIYYTVNGRGETLSRELALTYTSLALDEERRQWVPAEVSESLEYINGDIICAGALCDTDFHLAGDRFQQQWGRGQAVATSTVAPHSVDAATWAEQITEDHDNEIKDGGDDGSGGALGGSAPVRINFTAAVTDAAIYREWQFASDPEFDFIDVRVNELETERVFEDYGTVYARFVCGNNDGSCEKVSQTYTITIGESRLECPNAFSPGASEGVNDEWKVSYKSITRFECHIFNRWGVEVARLDNPSQGWNGRYKGKLVPSGVYYYVISATGADGKNYKLSGDINIIGYKGTNGTAAPVE